MPHKRIDLHFGKEYQKFKEDSLKKEIERENQISEKEKLEMMCEMYGDTYNEALDFKEQRDELLNVVEYSLEIVKELPCECDSYNGFTCKKHEWERKLRNAILKIKGIYKYYLEAAEKAKEDYFFFGIKRTEREVKNHAENLSKESE